MKVLTRLISSPAAFSTCTLMELFLHLCYIELLPKVLLNGFLSSLIFGAFVAFRSIQVFQRLARLTQL